MKRWGLAVLGLVVIALLVWGLHSCGGSSGNGGTTTHTMTLRGATS